jgi:murein DD-endopeptidase MepM/ murein hydrolase activator NlpD
MKNSIFAILLLVSLNSSAQIIFVDGFDYPFGDKGISGPDYYEILEDIDPEQNNYYPNNPVETPQRQCPGACLDWYNYGDVGDYATTGLHPGEDWNFGSGTDDAGKEIFAAANGEIISISASNKDGIACKSGWRILVKHYYEGDSINYSIYTHITTFANIDGSICMSKLDFTVSEGQWIIRGEPIARIATGYCSTMATHLHFEIRNSNFVVDEGAPIIYPRDNNTGTYGGLFDCISPCGGASGSGYQTGGMSIEQVQTAYNNMQRDGIIDASDFIDNHRPNTFLEGPPEIEWQNTIGGDDYDYLSSLNQTNDGGYVFGGYSTSPLSGDKTEPSFLNMFGQRTADYWVMKLNSAGNYIEWQNTLGGTNADICTSVIETSDNGYILGGLSYSDVSVDKSEPNIGGYDIWIVKLDSLGSILWDKTIGGTSGENLQSMGITPDGGYILGGSSSSNISADKHESNIGGNDFWVIKLDAIGNIEWENTIGGNNEDFLNAIKLTSDGGYIVGGFSTSGISGDKTETNKGEYDYWIVKLNASGNIEWQKTIGGNQSDVLNSIEVTEDGYLLGGYSLSGISGDKTEANIGDLDYWVVKLNTGGIIQWQNTIGGVGQDVLCSVQQTQDNGFILGGYSNSGISGDKTEASYGRDYWVVKINETGSTIEWQKTIGGTLQDDLYSVHETNDGGYILGGCSGSDISGDKTESVMGVVDYWLVKLAGNCVPATEICNSIDDDCDGVVDNGIVLTATITAGGPTTFCQGGSVLLTATYTGETIQWKKDGVNIVR